MSALAAGATAFAAPPPRRRLLAQLLRRPVAAGSLAAIALFALLALLAPLLVGDPDRQHLTELFQGPSGAHLLGTDDLGRDVLARLAYGARVSLLVGFSTTALALAVAVPLGLLAGWYGGWADTVIARGVDVMLAFPYLIVAVGLAAISGPSVLTVTVALAAASLPWLIRVVRGEVLSLREREYVAGALLDGAGDGTILWRYLLPNLTSLLIVQATLLIPAAIIGEALLSFLGVGVRPPTATWGVMLAGAQPFLQQHAWLAIVPGVAISVVTFAFNLLGDALRDLLDPAGRR